MKKIGILTYFGDLNSGTNLQAYCIQNVLRNKYGSACIIEIINYHAWNRMWEWHPYSSAISIKGLINDVKRLSKYRNFINDKLNLTSKQIISRKPEPVWTFIKQNEYDSIYIGSDTLLELDRYNSNEISAFWLPSEINAKVFLIAASSKNLEYDKLSDFQKEKLNDSINGMDLLGVRDEATSRLIRNFIPKEDKRLQIIPDPTFSYNIDYKYVGSYLASKKIDLSKPTICLHLAKDLVYSAKLASILRSKGYQIASLRPAYWADILLNDMSPLELIGIFKYFKVVVTHRFHDSIFCFKNLTPVILIPYSFSFANSFNESKYTSLFKTFGISETNLINSKTENTAENVVQLIEKTIFDFPKTAIEIKLNELSSIFNQYIDRTFSLQEYS
jgi:hypothetical protein